MHKRDDWITATGNVGLPDLSLVGTVVLLPSVERVVELYLPLYFNLSHAIMFRRF